MKTIRGPRELEEYGISLLTGESCNVGMRGLFDVTPAGEALLSGMLGNVTLNAQAWNGRGGAEKSAMLPYGLLPDVAAFALLTVDHADVVLKSPYLDMGGVSKSGPYAIGMSSREWEEWKSGPLFGRWRYTLYRQYRECNANMRNRHYFSGRTE